MRVYFTPVQRKALYSLFQGLHLKLKKRTELKRMFGRLAKRFHGEAPYTSVKRKEVGLLLDVISRVLTSDGAPKADRQLITSLSGAQELLLKSMSGTLNFETLKETPSVSNELS